MQLQRRTMSAHGNHIFFVVKYGNILLVVVYMTWCICSVREEG